MTDSSSKLTELASNYIRSGKSFLCSIKEKVLPLCMYSLFFFSFLFFFFFFSFSFFCYSNHPIQRKWAEIAAFFECSLNVLSIFFQEERMKRGKNESKGRKYKLTELASNCIQSGKSLLCSIKEKVLPLCMYSLFFFSFSFSSFCYSNHRRYSFKERLKGSQVLAP